MAVAEDDGGSWLAQLKSFDLVLPSVPARGFVERPLVLRPIAFIQETHYPDFPTDLFAMWVGS